MALFRIREAHVSDAPLLASAEQHWARTPGLLVSQADELVPENFENTIRQLADHPRGRYIVIEYKGKVSGHAFLQPRALQSQSHIVSLTIVVHPGTEGRGLGKAMMRDLIEWARRADGVEKIELRVRASNERAIGLYRKMGFFEEGRIRNSIKLGAGRYVDDVSMALFPKLELRRMTGTSEEIADVQRVMESAPRYFLNVVGQTARASEARMAFTELPPGLPRERKFNFGIYWSGELVGFADLLYGYPDPSFAYIGLLLLSEKQQSHGLGRQAYQFIEEQVSTWPGVQAIRLGVAETNDVIGFWRKMGFEPTGRRLHGSQPEIKSMIVEMDKAIKPGATTSARFSRVGAVFMMTDDVMSSSLWYEKLLEKAPVYRDENFASFRFGNQELCFQHSTQPNTHASSSISYWWTGDFEGTLQRALTLGGGIHQAPIAIAGERQVCQVMDPFGNIFGLEGRS